MNKAKELLDELQNLDEEIQNRIDELANLEASLLSSPKMSMNKVQGGHGDYVYSWEYEDQEELKEIKARKKEKRKKVGRLVKSAFITACTNGFLYIIFSVLKIILTPNYTFIVNEVLPRLTNR